MRNGDWKCPNCPGSVFSRKLKCKCGNHRYTKSANYLKLTNELSPNYWICSKCNMRWQDDVKKCLSC